MKIPFSLGQKTGKEDKYILEAIDGARLSGDQKFSQHCAKWLVEHIGSYAAMMTPSCTHALEMCALLANIKEGDEVVMPSFTFTSTANAFVLRGAKIIFVDIRPDTLNIDENKVEDALSKRTKLIVPVHYAGVGCEMDKLMEIASRYNLLLVEDAAQSLMASYKGVPLGGIGHLSTFSFHETKNIHCGEGGALIINDEKFFHRAEIIREKGTNRSQFFRGEADKYTWLDVGSSQLLGELNAAYLMAQLERAEDISGDRRKSWDRYFVRLSPLNERGIVELPQVPEECTHNGHIFYIKVSERKEREALLTNLKLHGICAIFHYVPLHSSPAGRKFGKFHGDDIYTTKESERLLRLPLYYSMCADDIDYVCDVIERFYIGG
jgi:dTDP-4-amino-4,6-dideoxygalactose transaminase